MDAIHMSARGRRFLEDAEGCRLVSYQDTRGIWTIGVGHTGLVRGAPLRGGVYITQAEADALLAGDLASAEGAVAIAVAVRPAGTVATQWQIDALVSFIFNAGIGHWGTSSIRSAFVAGRDGEVAGDLLQWTRAGDAPYELASRRAREALMFSRGAYLGSNWRELPPGGAT